MPIYLSVERPVLVTSSWKFLFFWRLLEEWEPMQIWCIYISGWLLSFLVIAFLVIQIQYFPPSQARSEIFCHLFAFSAAYLIFCHFRLRLRRDNCNMFQPKKCGRGRVSTFHCFSPRKINYGLYLLWDLSDFLPLPSQHKWTEVTHGPKHSKSWISNLKKEI